MRIPHINRALRVNPNVSTIAGSHCVSVFLFTFEFMLNLSMSDSLGLLVSLLFVGYNCFISCFCWCWNNKSGKIWWCGPKLAYQKLTKIISLASMLCLVMVPSTFNIANIKSEILDNFSKFHRFRQFWPISPTNVGKFAFAHQIFVACSAGCILLKWQCIEKNVILLAIHTMHYIHCVSNVFKI